MTPYDEGILCGVFLGLFIAGAIVTGMAVARREAKVMPGSPDWPESPLRPLNDADLRLIRVCEHCRRYIGKTRTLESGQHLNLLHDFCPHCAKRRAAAVAT